MIPVNEAMRYAGIPASQYHLYSQKTRSIAAQMEQDLLPKSYYRIFPLTKREDGYYIETADLWLKGKTARFMLEGCSEIILLCATLGWRFEYGLQRWQKRDVFSAVLYDACGSAYIEKALDLLQDELAEQLQPMYLTDRFSCGYGDLPLDLQKDFERILHMKDNCQIQVLDSNMMHPSKSVTAFIGISREKQKAKIRGCAFCMMQKDCTLRKEGNTCAEQINS